MNTMNTSEEKKTWGEQKDKLKQKFEYLTDNDLLFEEGKNDEMFYRLELKLGKTKNELRKIITEP